MIPEFEVFQAAHAAARRSVAADYERLVRETYGELAGVLGAGRVTMDAIRASVPALRLHGAVRNFSFTDAGGTLVLDRHRLEAAADEFAEEVVERAGWKMLSKAPGADVLAVSEWERGECTATVWYPARDLWLYVTQRIQIARGDDLGIKPQFAHKIVDMATREAMTERELKALLG